MPNRSSAPITFVVPGTQVSAQDAARGAASPLPSSGLSRGVVTASIRIGATRGPGEEIRVVAVPGEDVVVLHIANGPSLVLHPESARDLMLAQGDRKRDRGANGETRLPGEVRVPDRLQWQSAAAASASRGATRGAFGDVLALGFDIVRNPAADLVAKEVVDRVDAQVVPGVYRLASSGLETLKSSGARAIKVPPSAAPILVLLHGTFSETAGTFRKLWTNHPQRVRMLFDRYQDGVYALEHATLGVSPVGNALMLVEALPKGARLHIGTHSRGGLVAEVLVRVCANPTLDGEDLARFVTRDRSDLAALAALVRDKDIRVERVARVACPARGTLLASKRLDAFVSVLKWTLEVAGVPVGAAIVDFLGLVAQRRTDPAILPGLEAQMPDSALVQWLHAGARSAPGDLRVIAGDAQGDSLSSWLKTLAADTFFRTENDFVVNTASMYGGAPRTGGAAYVFDQGGKVSHFMYFQNEVTAEAFTGALVQDAPSGFRTIGPLSWKGESASGFRAPSAAATRSANDKPAVFVLPGILGSNLKVDGERVWLSAKIINGLRKLAYGPTQPDGVEPDGPIESIYDKLMAYLADSHEVIPFGYDWRRPMEQEARRLADAVDAALQLRASSGMPVRILAHSMGGLVARTMQLERPEVWNRMMSVPGARMLMLGTPNAGSWAPMQVLSADDTFGNMLVAVGAPFHDQDARAMMAGLPGFLQLQQNLLVESPGLGKEETWRKLADDDLRQIRDYNFWHSDDALVPAYQWGVPKQAVLDQAVALRKRLDAQVVNDLGTFSDRLLLVVGSSRFTPDGYEIAPDGLYYRNAQETGDGRVTRASALLPGVLTWRIDCEHGKMPAHESSFAGYLQLLEGGKTPLLTGLAGTGTDRGAAGAIEAPHVLTRPSRQQPISRPPASAAEAFDVSDQAETRAELKPPSLRVSVYNGDLAFNRKPLIVGHYRSLRLTGAESVVDRLLDGRLSAALRLGAYPDRLGDHAVFTRGGPDSQNLLRLPGPETVIVVGLGEEGIARANDLVHTIRQGAIEWSRRMTEQAVLPPQFELAATLIGSGGPGISAGQAAQLAAQAIYEANERIALENRRQRSAGDGTPARRAWPLIGHLQLVELYLERASEAWRALQVEAIAGSGRYSVDDVIQTGIGWLRRPLDSSYRGADYDLLSAVTQYDANHDPVIAYTMDTRRARTEVRAQQAQGALLRELIKSASNADNLDRQIGRTLFQLLIPLELESFLGGTQEMVLELDEGTGAIPWELLDADGGSRSTDDKHPWAIRTKLLRKMRTETFREKVVDSDSGADVLVIGEPKSDDRKIYPPLPGAYAEAKAVADLLKASGALQADGVRSLLGPPGADNAGPDARAVVNTLLERDWRVVHIAGHGALAERASKDGMSTVTRPGGVVLSGGVFLGSREIRNMRVVPQLAFINCCHLARIELRNPEQGYERPAFAANVAQELINIGVRCVVAAGWAVDDEPARLFAVTFYENLLRGARFMDAIARAREAAWQLGGNTWAAYQCYGDPDWVLTRSGQRAQQPKQGMADELAGIASPLSLVLALDTLAVKRNFQKARADEHQQKVTYLESRYASRWIDDGQVADAFARAYSAGGDFKKAIEWYARALAASDGLASIKAAEQLGNLRSRHAERSVDDARKRREALAKEQGDLRGKRSKASQKARRDLAAAAAKAERELRRVLREAIDEARQALTALEQLVAVQPTMERECLCGAACKRVAMIQKESGNATAEANAIKAMAAHYAAAEKLGRSKQSPETFYPALNRMAAELAVFAGTAGWRGLDQADVATVRSELQRKHRDDPDFWSAVGTIELDYFDAIGKGDLERALKSIEARFVDLHLHLNSNKEWKSVYDQARFVTGRYRRRAKLPERVAAGRLVELLEGMAG